MRLLFAIKSLNVGGGGAERVLVDVANGLVRRGHAASVLTFDRGGKSFYELDPRIARLDAGIGTPGQSTPLLGFLAGASRVRRLVREAHADLMIAFMHSTYVPVAIATLGCAPPIVFSEHIDAQHYRTRPLQRALVKFASLLAVAKTVPSEALRHEHHGGALAKVHVLPNAVDLDSFSGAAEARPLDPPQILSVGRFMSQKNHVELIEAFARVAPRFPEWRLKIVGDGDLRPRLEEARLRSGVQDRIFLPGMTRDIAIEYAQASIVALPSLYESFGLVAAEALASARPLIAFDSCIGITEMVRNGENGRLVSSAGDRVENLASGLAGLMADSALRRQLGGRGPGSVRRYARENTLDKWERLLSDLCNRQACRA